MPALNEEISRNQIGILFQKDSQDRKNENILGFVFLFFLIDLAAYEIHQKADSGRHIKNDLSQGYYLLLDQFFYILASVTSKPTLSVHRPLRTWLALRPLFLP